MLPPGDGLARLDEALGWWRGLPDQGICLAQGGWRRCLTARAPAQPSGRPGNHATRGRTLPTAKGGALPALHPADCLIVLDSPRDARRDLGGWARPRFGAQTGQSAHAAVDEVCTTPRRP